MSAHPGRLSHRHSDAHIAKVNESFRRQRLLWQAKMAVYVPTVQIRRLAGEKI